MICSGAQVLKPLSPPPMVDSKTFSGATDKEQKCHRLFGLQKGGLQESSSLGIYAESVY